MSGIVNSAGSRSGIIGSTEIPGGYEEGSISEPLCIDTTNQTSYYSTTNTSHYTRIGREVFVCFAFDTFLTTLVTTGAVKFNLPFTAKALTDVRSVAALTIDGTESTYSTIITSTDYTRVRVYGVGTGAVSVAATDERIKVGFNINYEAA